MIDQSHNLKPKIEAMIQTVTVAQELYAKAALVDHEKLAAAQTATISWTRRIAEGRVRHRCRPAIRDGARPKDCPADPLDAFRQSGYSSASPPSARARNAAGVWSYP